MADAYLALDQGTTSSRAVVYDAAGRALAQAQQKVSVLLQPGGQAAPVPFDAAETGDE